MDYEKKYKDALANARQEYNTTENVERKQWLEELFPELAKSEGEKIRRELITYFRNHSVSVGWSGLNVKKAIDWLEKQGEQRPLKVYRVENEAEEKGLWRKFDGTWQPLFDMLTDGKCKDMPMEDNPIYREGGKRWFASAPSKKTLREWFSKRDLEELVSKGFTITEFEVTEYKKVSDFEYIFTRDSIINKSYLEVSDIYSEQNPAWSEEDVKIYQSIIDDTVQENQLDDKQINWLRDIKYRYFPQPKKEWTDEEKNFINAIINSLDKDKLNRVWGISFEEVKTWLKSLRPKNRWKPSDLPHWKKSTLPDDDTTGFNGDYFCHKGYNINYKELFEKLPKDD